MTEDRRDHWERVYTTKSEDEVSWYQPVPELSLELIALCNLGKDSAIIDIGAGASTLPDHLVDMGYRDITLLDLNRHALEKVRKRLGTRGDSLKLIAADVTDWRPQNHYALWHDRAAFHFLTAPKDRAAYKERLISAVPSGGHVIISTFALDGPEKCSGLRVSRYSPHSLCDTLGEGFKLLDGRLATHTTPSGAVQRFQFSLLERV